MTKIYHSILFITLILLSCCSKPYINIYGDIPIGTKISSIEDLNKLTEIHQIRNLFIVTNDSIAVELRISSVNELNLSYNNKIWNISSETLPRTVNLKNISYIAVDSNFKNYQIAIFEGIDIQKHISAYQRIKNDFVFEASSEKNGHFVNRYNFDINDSISPYDASMSCLQNCDYLQCLFITEQGHEFDYKEKQIFFHQTHWQIDNQVISIIWHNYPKNSIYDINNMVKNEQKLMLILVDGLGYEMLQNAIVKNRAGYFETFDFNPMRSTFPANTKNALHAIGNGSDMFSDFNFSNVYIIQDDKFFFTSKFDIVLNTDRNNNGMIDDEIFETAMSHLEKDFDLLFVHFHSVDDLAHEYGPYSENVLRQIELVSSYVNALLHEWGRDFIILSDHGLHSRDFKGYHGTNRIEDMVAIFYIKDSRICLNY